MIYTVLRIKFYFESFFRSCRCELLKHPRKGIEKRVASTKRRIIHEDKQNVCGVLGIDLTIAAVIQSQNLCHNSAHITSTLPELQHQLQEYSDRFSPF